MNGSVSALPTPGSHRRGFLMSAVLSLATAMALSSCGSESSSGPGVSAGSAREAPSSASGSATAKALLGTWTGYCGQISELEFFAEGTVTVDRLAGNYSLLGGDNLRLETSGEGVVVPITIRDNKLTLMIAGTGLAHRSHRSCDFYRPGTAPSTPESRLVGEWELASSNPPLNEGECERSISSYMNFWYDGLVDLHNGLTAPYSVENGALLVTRGTAKITVRYGYSFWEDSITLTTEITLTAAAPPRTLHCRFVRG